MFGGCTHSEHLGSGMSRRNYPAAKPDAARGVVLPQTKKTGLLTRGVALFRFSRIAHPRPPVTATGREFFQGGTSGPGGNQAGHHPGPRGAGCQPLQSAKIHDPRFWQTLNPPRGSQTIRRPHDDPSNQSLPAGRTGTRPWARLASAPKSTKGAIPVLYFAAP